MVAKMPHIDIASVPGSFSSLWRALSSACLRMAEEFDANSQNLGVLNGTKLRKGKLRYFVDSTAASCRRTHCSRVTRLRKEVSPPSLAACPMVLQRSANADCSFSIDGNMDASNSGGGSAMKQTSICIDDIIQNLGTKYITCNEKWFRFPHI